MGDLLKPALYARRESGDVVLLGGRCACGYTFFPMQTYGCERCGSARLTPMDLAGRGRLLATATVHLHPDPDRPAPFIIGTIALDDGPITRTLLESRGAVPGRVIAVLVSIAGKHSGPGRLDLRFAPEGS